MNLTSIPVTPFAEGYIRVASTTEPGTGRTKFDGSIEVLARHHDLQKIDAFGEPRLANHEVTKVLVEHHDANRAAGKIVEVPIRMFFDKPANAITARYVAYDANGVPVCRGNGCDAKRTSSTEVGQQSTDVPCAGNDLCAFANAGDVSCRRQISMPVTLGDKHANPLSVFEVRTSSYHAYKALRGQLELIAHRYGGLRHVPLKLQLWKSSNQASEYGTFDMFKLNLDASSELAAMKARKQACTEEQELGMGGAPDSMFEQFSQDQLLDGEVADFEVVKDFYQPVAPEGGRRPAARSVVAEILAKAGGAQVSAKDVISQAVKSAPRKAAAQNE